MHEQILAQKVETTRDGETISFPTSRFGEVTVATESVIAFPRGLIGLPNASRFVFLHPEDPSGPFHWMQAVNDPDLAFVVCEPQLFFPDYRVVLSQEDQDALGISKAEEGLVCVILVVPGNPEEITANLRGPIVINSEKKIAFQLVLVGEDFPTRRRLFETVGEGGAQCSS